MLTGGRVLNHLRDADRRPEGDDPVRGLPGRSDARRHLQAGAKTARVDGQEYQVRCAVRSISGFSAHADEPGLLAWLGNFIEGRKAGDPGVPRRVFIVHGDPTPRLASSPRSRPSACRPWRRTGTST
jgi:metallo-beta-lactamase family protein